MDREERKKYYLECFIDAFAQNGIDKTSIKKLAQAAKMNEASIYQYFENKDEIIVDCIKHHYDNIQAELFPALLDEKLTLDFKLRRLIVYCSKIKAREKFTMQVLTHPIYSQLCSPIVNDLRENLIKISKKMSVTHSIPQQVMTPVVFLLLGSILSDKLLNNSETLSEQINYLLDTLKFNCEYEQDEQKIIYPLH